MFLKILKWAGIILALLVVVFFGWRVVVVWGKMKTEEAVQKIHNTKLMLADVMGDNLPPAPSNPDSNIPGFDANKNGIRDDVELAIFAEYPNSARTRAVLLQYALALQMEVTQELVNTGTVIAVAQEKSQAAGCIADVTSRDDIQKFITVTQQLTDFVKKKHINTDERDNAQVKFYEKLGSYSDIENICDIELSTLPN